MWGIGWGFTGLFETGLDGEEGLDGEIDALALDLAEARRQWSPPECYTDQGPKAPF